MPKFTRTRAKTERARKLRRTVSKTEARLWLYLSRSQLGQPFRRQHPVGPYFIDYFCVPLKLAIEIDGPHHDAEWDARRDDYLSDLNVTIMRFCVQDVDEQIEGVVDTIRDMMFNLQASSNDP